MWVKHWAYRTLRLKTSGVMVLGAMPMALSLKKSDIKAGTLVKDAARVR